jgi:hypothetical protein
MKDSSVNMKKDLLKSTNPNREFCPCKTCDVSCPGMTGCGAYKEWCKGDNS